MEKNYGSVSKENVLTVETLVFDKIKGKCCPNYKIRMLICAGSQQ